MAGPIVLIGVFIELLEDQSTMQHQMSQPTKPIVSDFMGRGQLSLHVVDICISMMNSRVGSQQLPQETLTVDLNLFDYISERFVMRLFEHQRVQKILFPLLHCGFP